MPLTDSWTEIAPGIYGPTLADDYSFLEAASTVHARTLTFC